MIANGQQNFLPQIPINLYSFATYHTFLKRNLKTDLKRGGFPNMASVFSQDARQTDPLLSFVTSGKQKTADCWAPIGPPRWGFYRSHSRCSQKRKNEVRWELREPASADIGLLRVKRHAMPRVIKTEAWQGDFSGIGEINREQLNVFTMCVSGLALGQRLSTHTVAGVSKVAIK